MSTLPQHQKWSLVRWQHGQFFRRWIKLIVTFNIINNFVFFSYQPYPNTKSDCSYIDNMVNFFASTLQETKMKWAGTLQQNNNAFPFSIKSTLFQHKNKENWHMKPSKNIHTKLISLLPPMPTLCSPSFQAHHHSKQNKLTQKISH